MNSTINDEIEKNIVYMRSVFLELVLVIKASGNDNMFATFLIKKKRNQTHLT